VDFELRREFGQNNISENFEVVDDRRALIGKKLSLELSS
jgi:hypothetical protein